MNAKTPPSPNPIRVLVVDSQATVREGLSNRLNADPNIHVVGTAATMNEALAQVAALNPHLAVIDDQLPDGGGPRLCRQIREQHPTTRCVLHTASSTNDGDPDDIAAVVVKQLFGHELADTIHNLGGSNRRL